jgi:GH24 family phage-related lysozyme (muramidase)
VQGFATLATRDQAVPTADEAAAQRTSAGDHLRRNFRRHLAQRLMSAMESHDFDSGADVLRMRRLARERNARDIAKRARRAAGGGNVKARGAAGGGGYEKIQLKTTKHIGPSHLW